MRLHLTATAVVGPTMARGPYRPRGSAGRAKRRPDSKNSARSPICLLTSPLIRARQTAKILTEVASWPPAEIAPELAPGEPAAAVLTLLAKDRSKRIAVVGHQPDLSALLVACLLKDGNTLPIEMKKNAVACLSFDGKTQVGCAVLKWLATPRMLRGFRDH